MNRKRRAGIAGLALTALISSSALGLAGCGTASDAAITSGATSAGSSVASTAASTAAQQTSTASQSYWNTCPKGLVNDPYPGRCGRYVDTDDDGICDLSQSDPNDTSAASAVAVDDGSGSSQTDDCPLGPCAVCGICAGLS